MQKNRRQRRREGEAPPRFCGVEGATRAPMMNSQLGFSLLEVMIAMAILAVSVLAILNLQSSAVVASGRAKNISIATMLARHQMAQSLLEMEKEMGRGYFPTDKSDQGDFGEIGFPDYRWELQIRRVEIPAPPIPEESGGEIYSKIVESITEQISEATREMKLTIYWKELGEEEESLDVTTHLVSLRTKGSSSSEESS